LQLPWSEPSHHDHHGLCTKELIGDFAGQLMSGLKGIAALTIAGFLGVRILRLCFFGRQALLSVSGCSEN
jgi:hypothetical protein